MTICAALLTAMGLACATTHDRPPVRASGDDVKSGLLIVESEVFNAVAYDMSSRRLTLYFDSGEIYVYHDISDHLFAGLMSAESMGRYFSRHIRDRCRFSRRPRATSTQDKLIQNELIQGELIQDEKPHVGDSPTRKGREP